MEEDNAETVWGDNSRSIRVVWPDMRSVALLSLLCSSGEILKPEPQTSNLNPVCQVTASDATHVAWSKAPREEEDRQRKWKRKNPSSCFVLTTKFVWYQVKNLHQQMSHKSDIISNCLKLSKFIWYLEFGWSLYSSTDLLLALTEAALYNALIASNPFFFFFTQPQATGVSQKLLTNAMQLKHCSYLISISKPFPGNTGNPSISRQHWQSVWCPSLCRTPSRVSCPKLPGTKILQKTAGYKKIYFLSQFKHRVSSIGDLVTDWLTDSPEPPFQIWETFVTQETCGQSDDLTWPRNQGHLINMGNLELYSIVYSLPLLLGTFSVFVFVFVFVW